MEPLQSVPLPSHGVLIEIDTLNSWPTTAAKHIVRLAYIATNSTERISFVTLQSAPHPQHILRLASRPSNFEDMPYGVVVEVHLAQDIGADESICLSLFQAGATTYYPPQQVDDGN
jgi:hypothetical protein